MTFEQFWQSFASALKSEPSAFPHALEWALDDSKDRMRRIFEASGAEALCIVADEMVKLSSELYGSRFGLPHAAFRPKRTAAKFLRLVEPTACALSEIPPGAGRG